MDQLDRALNREPAGPLARPRDVPQRASPSSGSRMTEPTWEAESWAWDGYGLTASLKREPSAEIPLVGSAAAMAMKLVKSVDAVLGKKSASKKGVRVLKACCQVPGCVAELAGSRAYYRRYRICEVHFRQPSMIFNNRLSRFCQQCAKFEDIGEFDGDKRSCRKQLNRHNERRKGRKARKAEGAKDGEGPAGGAASEDDELSDVGPSTTATTATPAAGTLSKSGSLKLATPPAAAAAAAMAAAAIAKSKGQLVPGLPALRANAGTSLALAQLLREASLKAQLGGAAAAKAGQLPAQAQAQAQAPQQQQEKQQEPTPASGTGATDMDHQSCGAAAAATGSEIHPNKGSGVHGTVGSPGLTHQPSSPSECASGGEFNAFSFAPTNSGQAASPLGPSQQEQQTLTLPGPGQPQQQQEQHASTPTSGHELDAMQQGGMLLDLPGLMQEEPQGVQMEEAGDAAGAAAAAVTAAAAAAREDPYHVLDVSEAAQMLLAEWAADDEGDDFGTSATEDTSGVHGSLTLSQEEGLTPEELLALQSIQAAMNEPRRFEPRSADSSVHGPSVSHGGPPLPQHGPSSYHGPSSHQPTPGLDPVREVLEVLSTHDKFDPIRAETMPLVRPAAQPHAQPEAHGAVAGMGGAGHMGSGRRGMIRSASTLSTMHPTPGGPGTQSQAQAIPIPHSMGHGMGMGAGMSASPPQGGLQGSMLRSQSLDTGATHTLAGSLPHHQGHMGPGPSHLAHASYPHPSPCGSLGTNHMQGQYQPQPQPQPPQQQPQQGGYQPPAFGSGASMAAAQGFPGWRGASGLGSYEDPASGTTVDLPMAMGVGSAPNASIMQRAGSGTFMSMHDSFMHGMGGGNNHNNNNGLMPGSTMDSMSAGNTPSSNMLSNSLAGSGHPGSHPYVNNPNGGMGHAMHGYGPASGHMMPHPNQPHQAMGPQHMGPPHSYPQGQPNPHMGHPHHRGGPGGTTAAGGSRMASQLGQANYLLVESSLARLTVKMHGVTPDALPPDLRESLTEWLAQSDVRLLQGFIRPGCVHLTLDTLHLPSSSKAASAGAAGPFVGLDALLQRCFAERRPVDETVPQAVARLFSICTLVEIQSSSLRVAIEGQVVWNMRPVASAAYRPVLKTVSPLAVLAGSDAQQELVVTGDNLTIAATRPSASGTTVPFSPTPASASPQGLQAEEAPAGARGLEVFVRSTGRFCQVGRGRKIEALQGELQQQQLAAAGPDGEPSTPTAHAPGAGSRSSTWAVGLDTSDLAPGLAVVECQCGRSLTNWKPVLVVDDPGILAEIQQLEPLQATMPERVQAIITDLGMLLQLRSAAEAAAEAVAEAEMGVEEEAEDEDSSSEVSYPTDDEADSDDDDDAVDRLHALPNSAAAAAAVAIQARLQPAAAAAPAAMLMAAQQQARVQLPMQAEAAALARRSIPRGSWDSEAFAHMQSHSSWGSTLTESPLARASVENPAVADLDLLVNIHSVQTPMAHHPTYSAAAAAATALASAAGPVAAAGAGAAAEQGPRQPAHNPFGPEVRAALAASGLRLLAFACDAGWHCTASTLMDILTTQQLLAPPAPARRPLASLTVSELVPVPMSDVLGSAPAGDGLTPLHRAARSGCTATVQMLLAAAHASGLVINAASCGAAGQSPLHLAAPHPAVAEVLLGSALEAPVQWFVARNAQGKTPAQLAHECGPHNKVNRHARALVRMLAGLGGQAAVAGLQRQRQEQQEQQQGGLVPAKRGAPV